MFSDPRQRFYQINSYFLRPQLVFLGPPQLAIREKTVNLNQPQSAYKNKHPIPNHLLQNHETEENRNFESCIQFVPQVPERKLSDGSIKLRIQNKLPIKKTLRNGKNSNCTFIDLSNIMEFPPQQKLDLNKLNEQRRINKRWTKEEDQLLFDLKQKLRLSWKEVASKFPTRTLKACQFRISRLKSTEQKKLKKA